MKKHLIFRIGYKIILVFIWVFLSQHIAVAAISGVCSTCHTMHNSQNGTSMNFDNSATPNKILLRADCIGCHAKGISSNIDPVTGAPQVSHTDAIDLAGGNFAYISGVKGSGASDAKGHNVKDFGNSDDVLDAAPGLLPESGHNIIITDTNLTCAGYIGCHGYRYNKNNEKITDVEMLEGAHHQNVDGKCDTADTIANSYRFLLGVKGFENTTDSWQNKDSNSHNEYFGDTTPMDVSCSNSCHLSGGVQPPNNTISGFCATCHGRFHDKTEIGGTTSPFKRHPTDIVLPSNGEYSAYTTYSVQAPVARTTVPDSPSPTVAPGSDVVMCLSCHAVHGTDHPDILRWDYSDMIAGDTSKSGGCFTCHTQKNQTP